MAAGLGMCLICGARRRTYASTPRDPEGQLCWRCKGDQYNGETCMACREKPRSITQVPGDRLCRLCDDCRAAAIAKYQIDHGLSPEGVRR